MASDVLESFDPGRCPQCGKAMKVRTNSENGSRFIGCTGYPDCRFTKPLPAYIELLEAGAEQLPGF
jgi:ssDNA-binding Zn-finger/Zn-ribbon topoisomerase 1